MKGDLMKMTNKEKTEVLGDLYAYLCGEPGEEAPDYTRMRAEMQTTLCTLRATQGRLRELDELYTNFIKVTGFYPEKILEMFSAGYKLAAPNYDDDLDKLKNALGVQESEEAEIVPLTLGRLREMDGQPVWIVEYPDWGHWELSEDAEDYVSDRVPEFYGMRYNDPDGKYGLHKLGWLAYAHPHAKIDPGVRQYKEYREAIKKMKQEREYFWKCIDHMHSRPPIWRVRAYIKWRKVGAEL